MRVIYRYRGIFLICPRPKVAIVTYLQSDASQYANRPMANKLWGFSSGMSWNHCETVEGYSYYQCKPEMAPSSDEFVIPGCEDYT